MVQKALNKSLGYGVGIKSGRWKLQALHRDNAYTKWPAAAYTVIYTRAFERALDLGTPPVMLSLSIQMGYEAGVCYSTSIGWPKVNETQSSWSI